MADQLQYSYPDGAGGFWLVPVKGKGSPTVASPSHLRLPGLPGPLPSFSLPSPIGHSGPTGNSFLGLDLPASGAGDPSNLRGLFDFMYDANFPNRAAQSLKAAGPPTPWTFGTGGTGVDNIIGAESGGNPYAANPRSSASGLGQFLDSTWMDPDLRKRAGYAGVDDKTWEANKNNPTLQIAMTKAYAARNDEAWAKKYGTQAGPGQLYGMHFLDAGPFMMLADTAAADPGRDAAAMFPEAAKANPEIFYSDPKTRKAPRSAGEVYSLLTAKGGGQGLPGDPFAYPQLNTVDPEKAMAMMPMPGPARHIELPTPPTRPQIEDRPETPQLPTEDWIAKLAAYAPKPFDQKKADDQRLGEVITGMARGAASVDARDGAAAVLAAMGAGASGAATAWQQRTDAQKDRADEAVRLFHLSLANQGINWDMTNREIKAGNAQRKWEDQRDRMTTSYLSSHDAWETNTRQALANNEIDRQFDSDMLAAKTNRARVGLSAIENNASVANQQLTGQAEMNLKRFLYEDEKSMRPITQQQEVAISNLAAGVGLDPKMVLSNSKDLVGYNALQGAAYIAANNKTGAVGALGRELVLSGMYKSLITDKNAQAKIDQYVHADPTGELAAAYAGRLLNEGEASQPGSVLEWAKSMAANGLPFATMFMKNATVQPLKPIAPAPVGGKK